MTNNDPDLINLAKQLMASPSVTPLDGDCQKIISERLTALGFHSEHMRFANVDNLWARYGQQRPLLVFAGHTDVVPPGPETEWTSPPFQPEIREGILYGRGASDMKAAIAAMLIAAEKFIQNHKNFPGSLAFLLTSDEEGDAINGTVKVIECLEKRKEHIDYCIVGEPSSDKQIGDQVRIGRRGSLQGKLTIFGKQGHVAHPHLAENPIHNSMLALHELSHHQWDAGNDYYPPTGFQISNIHSGSGATNVIPGHMDILCNFRYSTAVTVEELQTQAEDIFNKHSLHYTADWQTTAKPFLSQQGLLLKATQHAVKELTQLTCRLSTGGGTSDARFIAPTGAEVIELGTTNATAHHIDEHIPVSDLIILEKIYSRILQLIFV